jgi:hypothetical protein
MTVRDPRDRPDCSGADGGLLYHQPQNLSNIVLFLVKGNKNNNVMQEIISQ